MDVRCMRVPRVLLQLKIICESFSHGCHSECAEYIQPIRHSCMRARTCELCAGNFLLATSNEMPQSHSRGTPPKMHFIQLFLLAPPLDFVYMRHSRRWQSNDLIALRFRWPLPFWRASCIVTIPFAQIARQFVRPAAARVTFRETRCIAN